MTYLSDLKKLAQAATPGPWFMHKLIAGFSIRTRIRGQPQQHAVTQSCHDNDAAYIAACSPERILQLLAVIEAAKAAIPMLDACADDARKNSELDRVVDDFNARLAALEGDK